MMYKALAPYAIGVNVSSLEEGLAAAKVGGFQGLEVNIGEIANKIEQSSAADVRGLFDNAGILPAAFGLPTDWRGTEQKWQEDLEALPRLARAAAAIGLTRTATWVLSGSNDRDYEENYEFHVLRFKPIAQILADQGISLGLEFIGPKTLRDTLKFGFVHKMEDMLVLGSQIGPNVGLLLDAWHWYTSHGTKKALHELTPEQVVYVHVNDAPAGIEIDHQVDNTRALPGETGVIDIAMFLKALAGIGYDGPVTPEPFKKELADLPTNDARLKVVGESMDKIFKSAGL